MSINVLLSFVPDRWHDEQQWREYDMFRRIYLGASRYGGSSIANNITTILALPSLIIGTLDWSGSALMRNRKLARVSAGYCRAVMYYSISKRPS